MDLKIIQAALTVISALLAFFAAFFWYKSTAVDIPILHVDASRDGNMTDPFIVALRESAEWSKFGAYATGASAAVGGIAGLLSLKV